MNYCIVSSVSKGSLVLRLDSIYIPLRKRESWHLRIPLVRVRAVRSRLWSAIQPLADVAGATRNAQSAPLCYGCRLLIDLPDGTPVSLEMAVPATVLQAVSPAESVQTLQ
jgi:hypothetical protein